jgi:hypothetical protein
MRWKPITHSLLIAAATAAIAMSGCDEKKMGDGLTNSKDNWKQTVPKTTATPKKNLPDPGDYFPLTPGNSWSYTTPKCAVATTQQAGGDQSSLYCTTQKIDTMISSVRTVGAKKIFMMETMMEGNKLTHFGFVEDGDFVRLVQLEGGAVTDKGIAGKHNLKPGDSWKKMISVRLPEKPDGPSKEKSSPGKVVEKTIEATLVCGEPEYLALPSDDESPGLYKAICCRNSAALTPEKPGFYATCYSANLGQVAEYYTDVRLEIITSGIKSKTNK